MMGKVLKLGTYRNNVLRIRQSAIRMKLRCSQGTVSKVENGHKPRPWERARWAEAYELRYVDEKGIAQPDVERFEAMVLQARKEQVLKKPVSETEPLLATVVMETAKPVAMGTAAQEVRTA